MNQNLLCNKCGEAEADILLFFKKYHKESGRFSYLDPEILCPDCAKDWRGSLALHETRPMLVTFEKIGESKRKVGWLLSKRGLEANHLSVGFWRKKLWNIHFIYHNQPVG